jgi:hypothetical protein
LLYEGDLSPTISLSGIDSDMALLDAGRARAS